MINSISIATSGLLASAKKADIAAQNIVNEDSVGAVAPTKGQNSGYIPQDALTLSQTGSRAGGTVETISLNRSPPFVLSYEPDSPLANADGLVNAPNVSADEELITLKQAENAYKANAISLKTGQEMEETLTKALDHKA